MNEAKRRRRAKRKATLPVLGLDPLKAAPEPEHRTTSLTVRLTPTQRRQLQEMADRFGVTVTCYLLNLHAQAWETVHGKGGRNG